MKTEKLLMFSRNRISTVVGLLVGHCEQKRYLWKTGLSSRNAHSELCNRTTKMILFSNKRNKTSKNSWDQPIGDFRRLIQHLDHDLGVASMVERSGNVEPKRPQCLWSLLFKRFPQKKSLSNAFWTTTQLLW